MRSVQALTVAALAALITSCGGGDDDSPPPNPAQQPQTISFANAGPVTRDLLDGVYTNAASGGAGSGLITYESANLQVATVNSVTGAVTPVTPGSVQITATKAADLNYLSATAAYTLNLLPPDEVPFGAAIGAQDTQVTFPSWANGVEFLRTSQLDCQIANFASCVDNQTSILAGTVIDAAVSLLREGLWWLRRQSAVSEGREVSARKFGGRDGARAASFRGRLWLVGGSMTNDVWSSADGATWTQVTPNAGFPARSHHALLVFNDRLWVIGGNGTNPDPNVQCSCLNDVWSSADGVTWQLENADPPFHPRGQHAAVVFDGRMWVMGGSAPFQIGDGVTVWSSTDGVTWTAVFSPVPWGERAASSLTVFNNRMFLVGGIPSDDDDAVWSSADGIAWVQEAAHQPFEDRGSHAAGVIGGRLTIAGGGSVAFGTFADDVWSTSDGTSWTQTDNLQPVFSPRRDLASAVHEGRLFVIGGEHVDAISVPPRVNQRFHSEEVWSTAGDGRWSLHSNQVPLAAGEYYAAAHAGRLHIVGGFNGVYPHDGTASSVDGASWTPPSSPPGFPARTAPGVTSFDGRLWVVGGRNHPPLVLPERLRDVWSSTDGIQWTRATGSAEFPEREGAALVGLGGQLLLIGGLDGSGPLNDVWASANGLVWTRLTAAAGFAPRSRAGVAVFEGRVWIAGGQGATGPSADLWSSADGITWRLETTAAPTLPRSGVSLASHDGKLWMTGGYVFDSVANRNVHSNQVWSSADGITWTQAMATDHFSPRSHAALLTFDGRLWLLGGFEQLGPKQDIWSSADGVTWRTHVGGTIPYP
jgi:hypothetical protein